MATTFPTNIDNLPRPLSTSPMNIDPYRGSQVIDNISDAIEALEAKVGINSSADTNSIDYKLTQKANLSHTHVANDLPNLENLNTSGGLPINKGGTGATTAVGARTNLGLVIGTNVQAWDADLDVWAGRTAPVGTVVGTSDTQTLTNKTLSTGVKLDANADANMSFADAQRNIMLNSALNIWQIFDGISSNTVTDIRHLDKGPDRWVWGQNAGAGFVAGDAQWNLNRDGDTPNTQVNYSMRIDCSSADATLGATDETHIRYAVEGFDIRFFIGKKATFSFWVKNTRTGIYSVAFTNSARDRTYIGEYTVNVASTWEYKTITVPFDTIPGGGTWDYTTGQGIGIRLCLRAGTTYQGTPNAWNSSNVVGSSNQTNFGQNTADKVWFADFGFVLGDVALPHVHRTYAQDFIMCRRYFRTLTASTNGVNAALGGASQTTQCVFEIPITDGGMRAAPTVSLPGSKYGTASVISTDVEAQTPNATAVTTTGLTSFARSKDYIKFSLDSSGGGFTINQFYYCRFKTTNARLFIDAEL